MGCERRQYLLFATGFPQLQSLPFPGCEHRHHCSCAEVGAASPSSPLFLQRSLANHRIADLGTLDVVLSSQWLLQILLLLLLLFQLMMMMVVMVMSVIMREEEEEEERFPLSAYSGLVLATHFTQTF